MIAPAKTTKPTPVMISEVTRPHSKKVMPMAKAAGQTQGSGRYGGCGRFHPGGNSGGGGWGFSESMRFFHERGLGGGRDNGFLARFTIPADQQSEDAKKVN